MLMISIRTDKAEKQLKEYEDKITNMSVLELMEEFISYLDYTEESDSGREFHPVDIGSCRIGLAPSLNMVLKEMRYRIGKE